MNSNFSIVNEGNKISSSKTKLDSIISGLKDINNSISNEFQGNIKAQVIERINKLINECYDLEMEFVTMKNSLLILSMNIVDENKRQEKLKEQKKNG